MGDYKIKKMNKTLYVELDARKLKKQPLPDFDRDISDIISKNREHTILFDASSFPINGVVYDSDWSKSRLDILISLMADNPRIGIRTTEEAYSHYKSIFNGAVNGTHERYYLRPKDVA